MKRSRPLLVFLALALLCGVLSGLALSLTEGRIEAGEKSRLTRALTRLYPEGKNWEKKAATSGAEHIFVCRDEGNTPVYVLFLPVDLPREDALLAVAVKADGVILGVGALSDAGGVGLGEGALEEKALAKYKQLSALNEEKDASPSHQAVFRTVERALRLVQKWEGGEP